MKYVTSHLNPFFFQNKEFIKEVVLGDAPSLAARAKKVLVHVTCIQCTNVGDIHVLTFWFDQFDRLLYIHVHVAVKFSNPSQP